MIKHFHVRFPDMVFKKCYRGTERKENGIFYDIRLCIYKRSYSYELKRELTLIRILYTVLSVLHQIIH